MRKNILVVLAGCLLALPLCILPSVGSSFGGSEFSVLVQIPYEPPPKAEIPDIPEATPAPTELSEKDRERLESLIPLLEGQQEYWAIGEFVHYGKHSVPYLVKALKRPGPRLRYNAIETLHDQRAVVGAWTARGGHGRERNDPDSKSCHSNRYSNRSKSGPASDSRNGQGPPFNDSKYRHL
jgi:hypothetical protein